MADENAGKTLDPEADSGKISTQNAEGGVKSQVSVKLTRYSTLKNRKKTAKCRLTRNELKSNWSHLNAIQFETVSKRRQIDILVGSDHPVFHKVLREVTGHNPKDPVA